MIRIILGYFFLFVWACIMVLGNVLFFKSHDFSDPYGYPVGEYALMCLLFGVIGGFPLGEALKLLTT